MIISDFVVLYLVNALSNVPLVSAGNLLNGVADLFGGIVLFIIGILIIALIVAAAIVLLPAIIVAVVVWYLTGSFFYAGIAFLIIAVVSIIALADD